MSSPQPDLIVVGAGIVGLAHALTAARRGLHVQVVDRDAQANGASIRNFGFVTVTGQQRGKVWNLARRSAAIWREIAPKAGIAIEQEGLLLAARRPEAVDVIEAFAETEMAEGCRLLTPAQARAHCPELRGELGGALLSSADLRVESRTAIPLLARWLEEELGVDIRRGAAVSRIEPGLVLLADGTQLTAPHIIACPGDDWAGLFPATYAEEGITRCQLQMLRLAPPGWRLPNPVMSDLSMVRYLGYSELCATGPLRRRLAREAGVELDQGIHLIAVQSADGSLVVGDSHVYAPTPAPFADAAIDELMLRQFAELFGQAPPVIQRWTGTYASGPEHSIVRQPMPGVGLVVVTSGTGASTSFALAENALSSFLED
ncbi:TIGR03364 family FAD-dependent oxidoreductase [Altererythrobacter sp. CC-YST694]|uniref:TIGR03364 family FAD-dependent oxidoreductase n=1 Tax=Altererythrobacter sp. CC-YST694 TaxID=2755038 RepID=UPI001D00FF26|nr:TIGR03364 family FAD-dependent oxidoreductase [Altererythrobacter sp. CC-YST694]MCB5423647.1 TIGR03364 family FAD-dependent oxidoreductase [Altererythrobacter sp. CC-YST694]